VVYIITDELTITPNGKPVLIQNSKIPYSKIIRDDFDSILELLASDEKVIKIIQAPEASSLRVQDRIRALRNKLDGVSFESYGGDKYVIEVLPEFENFRNNFMAEYNRLKPGFLSQFRFEEGTLFHGGNPIINTKRNSSTRKLLQYLWRHKAIVARGVVIEAGEPQTIRFLGEGVGFQRHESARDIIKNWQKKLTRKFALPIKIVRTGDDGYQMRLMG